MLMKKITFRVNIVKANEDGLDVQKGIESLLDEYKRNNHFDSLYNGYSDSEIKEKKLYVTEYQEQEFRGYIEECQYEGRKNYKVYIKDYKEDCFHVGYVPFSKVPEIDEWINNNKLDMKGSFYIVGGNIKYYDANNQIIIKQTKEYEFEVELRFYDEEKTLYKFNKKWTLLAAVIAYTIIIVTISILIDRSILKSNTKKEFEVVSTSSTSEETPKIKEESNNEDIKKQVELNGLISEKDWELTIKKSAFSQDIRPSNPDSYYTHYQVKDTNNTYLYVKVEAKNISNIGLRADSIAGVKVKYNQKYEYNAFSTIEETGGGTFTYTNITEIPPLTTRTLYYMVELPKNVEKENTPLEVQFNINNTNYIYKIR